SSKGSRHAARRIGRRRDECGCMASPREATWGAMTILQGRPVARLSKREGAAQPLVRVPLSLRRALATARPGRWKAHGPSSGAETAFLLLHDRPNAGAAQRRPGAEGT